VTILEVVAAVVIKDDRVLACRRAPGKVSAGKWEFPGGKIEQGEEPAAALAREIREELATEAVVGDELDRSTTTVGELAIDLRCFIAMIVGDSPTGSTDHDELRWVTVSEAASLDWAAPDLSMVGKLSALLD
jgi:8-oxo-dGTP diphosphatase